jgi:predicted TIM-barrel fold metal-dependent hydrolase
MMNSPDMRSGVQGRSSVDAILELRRISADSHVHPPTEVFDALPDHLRQYVEHHEVDDELGPIYYKPWGAGFRPYTEARRTAVFENVKDDPDYGEREFRNEPFGGTNLDVRMKEQERDQVIGEVIYPNSLLGAQAHPNLEFQVAVCRLYNDFLVDTFGGRPDRFHTVALLPIIDIDSSIAEAKRVRERGLRSVLLPLSIPWRPISRPEYDPLWATLVDLGMPANFHTFTGNLAQTTDFADARVIPQEFVEQGRADVSKEAWQETLAHTTIGTAAGMGPIIHLIGGQVLERFPDLRFASVETEAGWLAWVLWSMDNLQHRRRLNIPQLRLLPSEYFLRQGMCTFTDDPVAINNLRFTGEDCLMWANDYPHDEGTYPFSNEVVARTMTGVTLATARKLLHDNAARFYGLG